jgi:hypothetical protein
MSRYPVTMDECLTFPVIIIHNHSTNHSTKHQKMITGIAHVNLTVPTGTLSQAEAFYAGTLGFTRVPVPVLQKDQLAWYPNPSSFILPFSNQGD